MLARLPLYGQLLRLNKPIGTLLLLWPTLWALWLAGNGRPSFKNVIIFITGVFLMRSAGCAINDFADRKIDGFVKRTKERPLAAGRLLPYEALLLAASLALSAFCLVLLCNIFTILLSFGGVVLAACYPFLKRITHLPQLGLGIAFSWGIPMAFAAEQNHISFSAWFLFAAAVLWPIIYDSLYAMTDRLDDLKIGVKSTAILFGEADRLIIALLQIVFSFLLVVVGLLFHLHLVYYCALVGVGGLFCYQQWLIKDHLPERYFAAFINNQWIGLLIFLGIIGSNI